MHPDVQSMLESLPPELDMSPRVQKLRQRRDYEEALAQPLSSSAPFSERVTRAGMQEFLAPPAIKSEIGKIQRQKLAKEYIASADAKSLELPVGLTLTELQEMPTPESKYAIDRLWPDGGNVLLAAQRKAGKTTVVGNLLRALVDGDLFLDEFAPTKSKCVALLDFELSQTMLQEWLKDQHVRNSDSVTVFPLNGRGRSFNILDDRTRTRWAEMLSGHDVLIVDPLRPILHALGLNEWNETGPLLGAFDALKREAGIAEGMIVQHHGHHSERAAGDSNLLGWPDAIWNITREDVNDPRSFRFFDAYGRDVDVYRGLLSMYDGRRLAFAADASAALEDVVTERVVKHLSSTGPQKKADLLAATISGLTEKSFTKTMAKAVELGRVTVEVGDKNAKIYSATATPQR